MKLDSSLVSHGWHMCGALPDPRHQGDAGGYQGRAS